MGTANDPLKLTRPPVEGHVLSTARPQRLVALAQHAVDLGRSHRLLRGLTMGGHSVVIMWMEGVPGTHLDFLGERHPLAAGSLVEAASRDPEAQRLLSNADGVLALGAPARVAVDEVARGLTRPVPRSDLAGWAGVAGTWTQLRARAEAGRLTCTYARHLMTLTSIVRNPAPDEVQVELADLVTELARSGHHDEAGALLPHLRPSDADPVETARRRAVAAQVRTSVHGVEDPDLRASAAALVRVTDTVLADGDRARAAALASICLSSLFRTELHSDGLSSPLVDDPDTFLAAWRTSRIGQLLGHTSRAAERDRPADDHGVRRVLVGPGSYPRFCESVTAELRARQNVSVETLEWGRRREVIGLGVRNELVEARLHQVMGEAVREEELRARLHGVDALFLDWADRGAALVLMHVPAGVRVTLRIHSMDALSPWIHLIDWSVVDNLVCVSDHLRDVVTRLLGDRLGWTTTRVVPDAVDRSRIPTEKSLGHRRHLLMVGWAPRVKDAKWALEVLALLRATDPSWHLTLVGPGPAPRNACGSSAEYTRHLRDRLTGSDVSGSVDIVPQTRDLAPHWSAAGFVLNTSRRESFALALVEGAASGAVPVVRNWPIFAGLDGARRHFPSDWVVDTVEEAVERIHSSAEATEWARTSASARTVVRERFLAQRPAHTLADIVLGEPGNEGW